MSMRESGLEVQYISVLEKNVWDEINALRTVILFCFRASRSGLDSDRPFFKIQIQDTDTFKRHDFVYLSSFY